MQDRRGPAFEGCPTASEIGHWFVENMRGVENVGGDAWWLSRDPHGSCRMLAFVDYDTQEFRLLEIATGDSTDLLFVMNGCDGFGADWWMHPVPDTEVGYEWHVDGLKWLASQIEVHYDYHLGSREDDPQDHAFFHQGGGH